MRKLKLIMATLALVLGWSNAWAEASYNHTYTTGVTVAAGGNYFLYNIGSKRFLTDGMDFGTHASADHAGRVVTLAEVPEVPGGYTIYSTPFSANGSEAKDGYLLKDGSGEPYVDGNDASKVTVIFTPVDVDGYTNAYTIKIDNENYLYYATADGLYEGRMGPFLRYGSNTGDNYSYWLIIPMSARQAVGDYTYLLRNGDFNHPWEFKIWTTSTDWTSPAGGKKENTCAEMYGKGFDIYQTISATIANGRYKLSNQAFYNNAEENNQTYLYANSDQSTVAILNAHGEGTAADMAGASDAFTAGQYVNSVETFVSNGSLKVGIKNAATAGNAWNIMTNFHLEYLGQCVMDYAVALPNGGAMTADTWYYFDIAVAGDNYNATATDLNAIICTTDGYKLTSATTGDITLTAENNTLSVTRYYVKSVAANNNLVVAPPSYTYTVGSPTLSVADNDYTNNILSTFTFDFSEAATNDPGASFALLNNSAKASLKKGGVQQAEGTLSLDGTVLTATFSDVALDLSSTYTIDLAADVVGYEGNETNSAISTSIKTGIITNGVYYFKRNGTETYLTRGGLYGTEAVTDKFGISFDVAIQSDGAYTLKNIDQSLVDNTNKYLNYGGSTYTDQTTAYHWIIASTTGGYYLKSDASTYMKTGTNDDFGYQYLTTTTTEGEAIIWTLLNKSAYTTALTTRKNAEAAAIATAAGRSETTETALISALASSFDEINKTSSLTNASLADNVNGWTAVSYNSQRRNQDGEEGNKHDVIRFNGGAEVWNYIGGAKQTISSLPEGIYKVTVKSVWRLAEATAATRAGSEANVTAWMYATCNGVTNYTQLKSWYDHQLANNAALHTSTNDEYVNTVYVYVKDGEDLTIGVASPSWCGAPWMPFCDFTLTYYSTTVSKTISDAGWATYCSPHALDFSSAIDNLSAAYLVTGGASGYVTKSQITTTIPANTGILLRGKGVVNIPVVANSDTDVSANWLVGVTANTKIAAGAGYVLMNDATHGVGFYQNVNEFTVGANTAYLSSNFAGGSARSFFSLWDDETTSISDASRLKDNGEMKNDNFFNLNGQRVAQPAKGLYIKNGKKVMVK